MNRPKAAAYRAPGAPMAGFATESAIEEAAHKIGMDPLEMRMKNVAKEGDRAAARGAGDVAARPVVDVEDDLAAARGMEAVRLD